MISSPIKIHGGSYYIAAKTHGLIPPHRVYVEPFFGSGAFLFRQDPHNKIEVANDLNEELTNFWRTIRSPYGFEILRRYLECTPYSEIEFQLARQVRKDNIIRAANFFILSRQSLSARRESFAPIVKTRTRRGMCDNVSAWLSAIDGLPEVHERIKRVSILCQPATKVIAKFDGSDTFVLADPPWQHSTRTSVKEYGQHEMSDADHEELLTLLVGCKSKVMLLGYHSPLYDNFLKSWVCHEFPMANHSGVGKIKSKRVPCVWLNY